MTASSSPAGPLSSPDLYERRPRREPRGRRAALFAAICAGHVALFTALMAGRAIVAPSPPITALQATLLTELPERQAPPTVEAILERVTPTLDPPPRLEFELPTEPSTAILLPAESDSGRVDAPPVEAQPAAASTPPVVTRVEYLRPPLPRYPAAAKQARHQGVVELQVLVDPDGRARDVRVRRSSGHAALDVAALDSLRVALFRPYQIDGTARQVVVIVPIEFSLKVRTAAR